VPVTVVSFPDALQLCQRCVGLLKTDARICVEGSQQAMLCVQLKNSSVDLTELGNLRRRTRHREVIWIICSSLRVVMLVRVGMSKSNHHGRVLSCVAFFSVSHC
jgi:hypothetical protein